MYLKTLKDFDIINQVKKKTATRNVNNGEVNILSKKIFKLLVDLLILLSTKAKGLDGDYTAPNY